MLDFIEALQPIIEEHFGVLSQDYIGSEAEDVVHDFDRETCDSYEIRYVLIDRETAQIDSRALYEKQEDAINASRVPPHENCTVATLLIDL